MRIRYLLGMILVVFLFLGFWSKILPLIHKYHVLTGERGGAADHIIFWCSIALFAIAEVWIFKRAFENPPVKRRG